MGVHQATKNLQMNSTGGDYLKTALKKLGAKTFGNKKELYERYRLWTENNLNKKLFTVHVVPPNCLSEDFPTNVDWTPLTKIQNKTIKIKLDSVQQWFRERGAMAGFNRGRPMGLNGFVLSVLQYTTENSLSSFYKGSCKAQMKSKVVYNVKIQLGELLIERTTCDCPAGKGWSAACKHVAAILVVIENYKITDTTTCDQPYLSLRQPAEYKKSSDCSININCNIQNEVNVSRERLNNNTSSQNYESPIENRIRNPKRERRPDRAVYVPRHRRLNLSTAATGNIPPTSNNNLEHDKQIIDSTSPSIRKTLQEAINEAESFQPPTKRNSQLCDIELIKENNSTKINNISNKIKHISSNTNNNNSCKCNNSNNTSSNNSNIFTTIKSDRKPNENSTAPIVTDSNNSSPKLNLNHFVIEENPDNQYQLEETDNLKMNRKEPQLTHNNTKIFDPFLECQLMNETNSIKSHTKSKKAYDKEMDDWDTLYDDNGDCVDPNLSLSELTISVDKSPPNERQKSDSTRHSRTIATEEFPHVLEVSNFPVEFKTQDLMMLFTSYKSSGFDIKWVDDTHALAIFSSSQIASGVLSMNHPFVSLKPLPEATMASRNKARKCAELLQPYRQRPETCVALARRLVTGALGVKLKTSKEELENERRILRNAKEKRILAAKLRDEIWEDC